MDSHQQLVPAGVMGELVVAGDGLARGYTDSKLDVDRFVPITIDGKAMRAYRTGDRARYRPKDGQIEFFGRLDRQIKIRGHRVEIDEVEHAMLGHNLIHDAAVVVCEQEGKELEMVGFVVTRGGNSVSNGTAEHIGDREGQFAAEPEKQIRSWLQTLLPHYMVPARIVVLDQMPVNANGKVDRQDLARRGQTVPRNAVATITYVAPRNEIEISLCEEFAEVLAIETEIGITDNFFDLGGHSLMATKLAARISRRLDARISVKDIFDQPRIVDLAASIRKGSTPHRPIPAATYSGPTEQSFAQGRLWFLDQLNVGATWYLMPLAVRMRGPLNVEALTIAITALEQRHETLRTIFTEQEGIGMQIVQPGFIKDLKVIDISTEPAGSHVQLLQQEQTTPFDLTSEPGWRVLLIRLRNDDYILSIVMHHIVSDGWSIDILCQELGRFYAAALLSQDPLLGAASSLPIQYRDFSLWQKQAEQAAEHRKQLEYWTQQLIDSSPAEFLADRPRPAVPSGQAGIVSLAIEGPVYESLRAFCRSNQITAFTVLLAAFRAAHYRLTGAEDGNIGTPIANRNRPELENMIGFFVNTQCIRTSIESDDTFEMLVQQVRSATTAAFAAQDVPFEQIVSALLPGSRDTSRNPLVQLIFALHSQQNLGRIQLEGLELAEEPLPTALSTRFDVEFHLFQEAKRLSGSVVYATDLFEPETIQGIVAVFQEILQHGLAQPQTPIATFPLTHGLVGLKGLLEIERTDYPQSSSVIDVFTEQVAINSDAIAVTDSSSELTYRSARPAI